MVIIIVGSTFIGTGSLVGTTRGAGGSGSIFVNNNANQREIFSL